MKKIITTAVASSLLLGTSVTATAAPAIERDAADVFGAERGEGNGFIVAILVAAAIAGGIILLESSEDDDDLPTSP